MTALERASFAPERQEGQPSIRRSILSEHQEVWVVRDAGVVATCSGTVCAAKDAPQSHILASSVLRIGKNQLRIYSIAVAQAARGRGLGQLLLEHAVGRARALGKTTASLEADAANPQLVQWYLNNGFMVAARLPDYYGRRQHGLRMRLGLQGAAATGKKTSRKTP